MYAIVVTNVGDSQPLLTWLTEEEHVKGIVEILARVFPDDKTVTIEVFKYRQEN